MIVCVCVCCFHGSKAEGSRGLKPQGAHLHLKAYGEERGALIVLQMHRSTQSITYKGRTRPKRIPTQRERSWSNQRKAGAHQEPCQREDDEQTAARSRRTKAKFSQRDLPGASGLHPCEDSNCFATPKTILAPDI